MLVEGVGAVPRPAGPEWGAALAHGGNVRPVTSATRPVRPLPSAAGPPGRLQEQLQVQAARGLAVWELRTGQAEARPGQ